MSLTFNKVLKFFAFSMIFVLITEDLSGQRRQRSQTSSSRSARDAGTQTDTSGDEYDHTPKDSDRGSKGGIKGNGYSINSVGVTAHLTKALQESIAKIETLETKDAAIESS